MSDEIVLYKDQKDINHRTLKVQYKYLGELAKICKEASSNPQKKNSILKKGLKIPETIAETPMHNWAHEECIGCDTNTKTEKRICRCMYYNNQQKWPKLCEKDSKECKFFAKWVNKGKIKIIEYEKPTKYVLKHVGGIDLILQTLDGKKYGVEVKPYGPNSYETVGRMVAEILSYTIDDELNPGIAVFKDSYQYKMIKRLNEEKNKDWEIIKKNIKVFVIKYEITGNIADFEIDFFED